MSKAVFYIATKDKFHKEKIAEMDETKTTFKKYFAPNLTFYLLDKDTREQLFYDAGTWYPHRPDPRQVYNISLFLYSLIYSCLLFCCPVKLDAAVYETKFKAAKSVCQIDYAFYIFLFFSPES